MIVELMGESPPYIKLCAAQVCLESLKNLRELFRELYVLCQVQTLLIKISHIYLINKYIYKKITLTHTLYMNQPAS